ncbi:5-methylcytosine-specific restriction enzyme B [Actinomadura madurae]|uniref:5-methylcytosine-specific restriction enzyme B n=2 Tax=Actinomadura madurae TaxID=1993 RepID=A0A1I5AL15_9ACTN|nr:5-methylcytosine-specific restriction enzyme B [Actinomadura madurae]
MAFAAVRILASRDQFADLEGLRYGELSDQIFIAVPDLEARWREMSDDHRWSYAAGQEFRWATTRLQKAGWLNKRNRKWWPTGLGCAALDEYPDPVPFYDEASKAFQYWRRNKDRFETATEYAEALPEGQWASVADVAFEAGVDATALVRLLQGHRPEGWHRLLADDGALPREAHLTEPEREEWFRLLDEDSVPALDGRADPQHRMAAADLRLLAVPDVEEDARSRRAWLVRASDVLAGDLITDLWLPEGRCSLAASRLRDLPPGAPVEQVAHAVREDYSGIGVQDRERLTAEYHAFLSRMGENDIVVTNNGSDIYLGVVTGRPFFVSSVGERANLQRAVEWRNADRPADYDELPDEFSVLVGNPDAEVVELTTLLPDLEKRLGEPVEVPERTMRLPDATGELARHLLVDRAWLQECVELLRERPQLIFYGPPGTGKTYLARHLARHLTSGRRECVQLVQFHPAYSYEDFFEGYRPAKTEDGTVSFDLVRGPLRRVVTAARAHPGRPYVLIIDEINRGNLAKIFGELYFLLEYRKERVNLLYGTEGDEGFWLPDNVIIIGTMNTADRSIALVDTAMRRRFWFTELHPDAPPARDMLARWLDREDLPDEPARLLAELNSRIEDRDFKVGPSYLMRESAATGTGLERIWRTQILPLLEEHHYGDGTDVPARYGLDALRSRLT